MRCFLPLVLTLALGVIGCSGTTGTGGSGGTAGEGGSAGMGGGGGGGASPLERAWGTPAIISGENCVSEPGELAVNARGSAVAVWLDCYSSLWTRHYTPNEGWHSAQMMETDLFPDVEPPAQVAISLDGTAVLVWRPSQPNAIWARRYTPGGGWDAPELLDRGFGAYSVSGADVAMDDSGRAIATWRRSSEGGSVFASRYGAESGWSQPQRINDEPNVGLPSEPTRVAMNAAGDAIAIWKGDDGIDPENRRIFANQYTPETGWGTSTRIDGTNDTFIWGPPRVAVDGDGSGMVVWQQEYSGELPSGTSSRITANRYTSGGGWGDPAPIEGDDQTYSYVPDIAMSVDGTATVVWIRSGVDGGVFAMRDTPGAGWEPEVRVFEYPFTTGLETVPRVAANAAGEALSIWRASSASGDIVWSSDYVPNEGWDPAVEVNVPLWPCSEPQVGIDTEGNGIAFWAQFTESHLACYANHYEVGHGGDSAPRSGACLPGLDGCSSVD